jgi:hypothetical protein
MDLDDLNPTTGPAKLRLVHPGTGVELEHEGKPVVIYVLGPDTDKMQRVDRAIQAKRLKAAQRNGRINLNVEEIEAETIERLATSITGWENIFRGGEAISYSHEAARDLMRLPWMRDQVDEFYRDRGNFIAASTEISKPH